MSFSETVKLEAKQKSHYRCCICMSTDFLDIHHIIPVEKQGADTIDNAAPLCKKCHDIYQGNVEKVKWIREKRDYYEENKGSSKIKRLRHNWSYNRQVQWYSLQRCP